MSRFKNSTKILLLAAALPILFYVLVLSSVRAAIQEHGSPFIPKSQEPKLPDVQPD